LHQVDEDLKKRGIVIPLKHAACTASTILYKTTHLDGVRIGLGCYGLHPSRKTSKKINLKPVLSLNTKIVQIKNVPKNTKVGYGGVWVTKKPTRLAIIPIGYFDGYDRKLSNNVEVIIKNKRCALRGRICMNLSIIDVTNIKNIAVGDRVVLLGKTARQQITADELAQKISTINYEIVTRLNPFLPRHITQRK
jgi:alanine racemase